ncbi:MAG: SDR family oxidoreductase [Ginsengibacter sp.]
MTNTIMITGASGGIGKELALVAAENHNNLVLIARSEAALKELCQFITNKFNVQADYLALDLAENGAAEMVYKQTKEKGLQINYLINNAGIGDYGNFLENDIQKVINMILLNISALTELTWYFANEMVKEGKGGVLNIASTASFQPDPFMAVYGATKSYVANFTEALSYELKDTGVTATVVSPGATETSFFKVAKMDDSKLMNTKMMKSEEVARTAYHAMMKGKLHVVPGFTNKILGFISSITPPMKLRLAIAAHILKKG